ncbi:MAG: nuclease-related domain-containing protein [Gammaproteobacteria bacterium]
MNALVPHAYWLVPLLLAVVVAGALVVRWYRRRDTLEGVLRRIAWARLEDVIVPDDVDGEIHLDLALLTPKGILVLDVRRGAGTLFWGEQLDYWTLLDGRRREQVLNPLPGLRARRHAVHALAPRVPVSGRILLLGPVEMSGGTPPGVVTPGQLVAEFGRPPGESAPPELSEAWAELSAQARRLD